MSNRVVRAFGDLPTSRTGGLQKDSARGSAAERQYAHTGDTMTDGGNTGGRTLKSVKPYMVPEFQGRSGQPDNQSTNRGKGRT